MGVRPVNCLNIPTAVLYGSLSLFVSILHNVFLLYYVDTFVSVYKIDKLSFWIGEVSDSMVFFLLKKKLFDSDLFLSALEKCRLNCYCFMGVSQNVSMDFKL